ncbi:hypothetical protein C1H46_001325 [Malus baccata]|uniref:Uncharacterized protein n=1 Tax=Malus baccata TaxID=106549 RepID=A0A540NQW5_MALBA|nr:hypothetical protein C1H46_001325 [Malus baccata]
MDHYEEAILQTLYISVELQFLLSQFINLGFGRNWNGTVIFWVCYLCFCLSQF